MSKKDYSPKTQTEAEKEEESILREIAEQEKIIAEAKARRDSAEEVAKPLRAIKNQTKAKPTRADNQSESFKAGDIVELSIEKGGEIKKIDTENKNDKTSKEVGEKGSANDADLKNIKADLDETFQKQNEEKQNKIITDKLKIVGLTEGDFANNKEWETFSTGEKLLIVEQLAQETLSHVKEIGEKRFQQKNKINFSWNPTKWAPFSVLNKIKNNIGKAYWISKEEKQVIEEARLGKIKPSEQSIKMMVERTADMHLNVVEQNGRAVIEFIPIDKNLPEEQQKIMREYNEVANEFARMPDSWRNEKSANSKDTRFNKKNYENFMRVKASYEKAKASLLKINEEKYLQSGITEKEASGKAMLDTENNDSKIAILQFLNTNPDVMGELDRIRNESSVKRLFNNENIWRAGYMAVGFGARSLTVSILGLLAAPIVGGAIGGARARKKAGEKINLAFNEGRKVETFRERQEAGKRGLFDDKDKNRNLLSKTLGGYNIDSKEVGAFVDADSQIQRLENILSKIDQAKTDTEKLSLKDQLYARIKYVEDKHGLGLINYGTQNVIGSNYELFKKLSEARAQLAVFDFIDRESKLQTHDRRATLLGNVMRFNETRLGKTQARFKTQETIRGAMVAGGFALLGWQIRDWMSGGEEEIANNLDSEFSNPLGRTLPGHNLDNTLVENPHIETIASRGDGGIVLAREIQKELKAKYGDDLINAPDGAKHAMSVSDTQLAKEWGLYNPNQANEIAFIKVGDKIIFDENSGKATIFDHDSMEEIELNKNYSGKMVDIDNSGVKIENNTDEVIPIREPDNISHMGRIIEPQVDIEMHVDGNPEIIDLDNPAQDAGPGEIEDEHKVISGVSETKAVNIEAENNDLSSLTFAKGEIFKSPAGYDNFTAEEMTQIFKAYDHDLNHLFSDNRMAWLDIKHSVSTELLMSKFSVNELNDTYLPLARYINRLEEVTDLTPESATEIRPAESIPNFIYRALHEAKRLNKLDEVGL